MGDGACSMSAENAVTSRKTISGARTRVSPSKAPPATLLEGAALFLDFDGTLVELAKTPDTIQVDPELPSLLKRLATALDGRLAIVSGRSIEDLERHVD